MGWYVAAQAFDLPEHSLHTRQRSSAAMPPPAPQATPESGTATPVSAPVPASEAVTIVVTSASNAVFPAEKVDAPAVMSVVKSDKSLAEPPKEVTVTPLSKLTTSNFRIASILGTTPIVKKRREGMLRARLYLPRFH